MTIKIGSAESSVLIYAPAGKDAHLAEKILAGGDISSQVCSDFQDMLARLEAGAGALLTVEEVLADGALRALAYFVDRQPTWSDLPILVLTSHGADSIGLSDTVELLGNVTLLERPVRTATLISAARSALRGRARQYQVREAERRKDEFLAALGHELRNPLAPIRTSMHILKRMYPAAYAVTQVREVVERQVTHLTRLVDDLLDVARITSGKVELHRERVLLSTVMDHAIEISAPIFEANHHKLEVSRPPEEVILNADPVRLVQSLANILANAAKYTVEPGCIVFKTTVEKDTVVFSIKDCGIGIPADALTRIFEMFLQNDPAPGRVLGGLGIGLSLAKRFTEMHGGTIVAHSAGPGQGSEFLLRLPIVVPQESGKEDAGRPRDAQQPVVAANRQVLVVDDNRDGADMLHRLFEADGFTVATAYDGFEAIKQVSRSRPDIVVMDIGMPGMDGYEAVRRIRQQPGGENILMIALTGWGQEDARRLTAEAGFNHHMVKPVDFDVLKGFLEKVDISPGLPDSAAPTLLRHY
jgi:signal transduction histidine kinase/ActR/RegA family two-component response regulator